MSVKHKVLPRGLALVSAIALIAAAVAPALVIGRAHAAGFVEQVKTRSILMSTSTPSAAANYTVQFNIAHAANYASTTIKGIVVDFCDDSPILGDTTAGDCDKPSGLSTSASPTVGTFTIAGAGQAGWTYAQKNSNQTFVASKAAGYTTLADNNTIVLQITSMTNPSGVGATGTFYARIYTFDVDTNATGYTLANAMATSNEGGGIALSTAALVTVTGKVQEQLTFCVYTGANCAAGGTSVGLGNALGVLSSAGNYTDISTKFDIATNANGNANIVAKSAATLTSGGNSITAIGASQAPSSAGSEQFGFCVRTAAGITATAPYLHANCNSVTTGLNGDASAQFAFDTAALSGASGDDIAFKTPGASATGGLAFIANIAPATEAGIYTTTIMLIATGTY